MAYLSVSVIIPMHNAVPYIQECVDSIRAQSLKNIEILLVDDASTDKSYVLCQQLYGNMQNVKIFHCQKNQGVAHARNLGLEYASARYIVFVDADDCLEPNYLKNLYQIALQRQADVVAAGFQMLQLDGQGKVISCEKYCAVREETILSRDTYQRMDFMLQNKMDSFCWGKLYARNFLLKHGLRFDDLEVLEDTLFSFRALYYATDYVLSTNSAYIYRQLPESASHGRAKEKLRRFLRSGIQVMQCLAGYFESMEKLCTQPVLMEQIQGFFWGIHMNRQLLPICKFYSLEEINAEILPLLQENFQENTSYIQFMLDYIIILAGSTSEKQEF